MKRKALVQGEIIANECKYTEFFNFKSSSPEAAGQFQSKLV
jgi:predicted nucleic-acid-binding Zn-ribbon protein